MYSFIFFHFRPFLPEKWISQHLHCSFNSLLHCAPVFETCPSPPQMQARAQQTNLAAITLLQCHRVLSFSELHSSGRAPQLHLLFWVTTTTSTRFRGVGEMRCHCDFGPSSWEGAPSNRRHEFTESPRSAQSPFSL